MTALSASVRQIVGDAQAIPKLEMPVAATTTLYIGSMVCDNGSGYAVPASATAGLSAVFGVSEEEVDNSAGAAGDLYVKVRPCITRMANSAGADALAITDRYDICFAADDATVAKTDAGNRPVAGIVIDVDSSGVWVAMSAYAAALGGAAAADSSVHNSPIFHVRGAGTANIANLASFTVAAVDGLTYVEGERILLKDQTSTDENGIYVCGAVAGGTCALTRATDADGEDEIVAGMIVTCSEGTVSADRAYQLTTNETIDVGVTNLVFAEIPWAYGVVGTMTALTAGGTASAGTANEAARIDHKHASASAAAVSISSTNAEGAADTFARSNHTHIVTSRVQVIAEQFVVADLTAAALSETLVTTATVPDGAYILGVEVSLATPFTGGGATACTIDVGLTGEDTDAILDGTDVLTAAVSGRASALTAGIAPNAYYGTGTTLDVTFTSDVNVSTLTAGDLTLRVLLAVAD